MAFFKSSQPVRQPDPVISGTAVAPNALIGLRNME